jgi:lysophospholipid acyltransferase (LPLAT)-like uncharacterized protein
VLFARVASGVVGAGVLGLRATVRIEALHRDREDGLTARGEPIVYALWHGRMVLCILAHVHENVVTMASRSKDGEIIARWLARNGYIPARGSTRKGGLAGIQVMIEQMRAGYHRAAITIDGPKGPPRVAQRGVLELVKQTGAWVMPFTSASSRPVFLKSWDRYLVPKPFSRCVVLYGEPFRIPADTPDRKALSMIGEAVDAATLEADRAVGVVAPPPWAS